MRALQSTGQDARLRDVFAALPPKWKAQITRAIEIMDDPGISPILASPSV